MASAASSSSFLAGVVEDHKATTAAAKPCDTWTSSVVTLRTKASTPVARATVAAITRLPPPSHLGNNKRRDGTTGPLCPISLDPKMTNSTNRRRGRKPVSAEMLDQWIRGSVTEIVKRIEEAPFLSYIFANDDDDADVRYSQSLSSSSSTVRFEREAGVQAEDWLAIQQRWGSSSPDGVILVEELKSHQLQDDVKDGDFGSGLGSAATRTWGVLVQGRGGGAECTACYVLNTCRVLCGGGCCTHFCLVRAQYSKESADAQLKKAWLAYGQWQQH